MVKKLSTSTELRDETSHVLGCHRSTVSMKASCRRMALKVAEERVKKGLYQDNAFGTVAGEQSQF